MHVRRSSSFARMLVTSALSVAAITALAGSAASAGTATHTTRPALGGSVRGTYGVGNPLSVDRKRLNVNVSNKTGPQSETTVAVNPTNPLDILAASNDLTGSDTTHVYESTDGGKHWSLVTTGISGFCYDPWLHFNDVGDAFFSYECNPLESYAYRLHGTTTWVLTTFPTSLTGTFPDRDMITTDDTPSSAFYHSAYVGYDDANAGNAAYVLYSRDSKTGWTRSPKINDSGITIGVSVSVAPDGTVYATWLDYGNHRLMSDKSTNGGATWGTDHVVVNLVSSSEVCPPPQADRCILLMPFSDASPAGTPHAGRVYVAYEDKKSGGTDTNVYVTSSDNGSTWSTPVEVNDDTGTAYQFFPAIAVNPAGTVGVSFYDTRRDSQNHKVDQFFSYSTDGGATWQANFRVTTAQSDETGSHDGNQYGDYEGLDSAGTKWSVVWTDSRPGDLNEELYWGKAKSSA